MGLLRRALSIAVVTAVLTPTTSLYAQQPADAAKASMADGDKAAKAKDWKTAITLYDAANKSAPSEAALDALANAYYQAGDMGGAFSAYTEWNDKYGAKATPAKKKNAETRLKELTEKTGGVTITVSEPGAIILVDDKQVGVSPLPGQLRLSAGPHHIKITKDGFLAFDQSPTVAAGTMTAIDAKLSAANAKSKITVEEKGGHPVRVIIDGIDRGPAPFTGDIDPGAHDVVVRGAGFAAPLQKVVVERDKPLQVSLVAIPTTAPVRITTSDSKGSIFIDGALVGEGSFNGELGGGNHELKITREGHETLTEQIVVNDRDPVNKSYTLQLRKNVTTQAIVEEERLEGVYGGFGLVGFATPGGTGNTLESQCEDKGAIPTLRSCSTPDGLGAGLGGFVGYHWDPVGVELFLGGHYDQRTAKSTWDSAALTGGLSSDPARSEEFNIRRAGGMALVRVRLTKQWRKVRLMLPFGAGVSYRVMLLDRDTRALDSADRDVFVASTESYWSPTIAFEPTVAYRITPGVAVTLGVQFWLEAPGSFLNNNANPTTQKERPHRLGLRGLSTPSYELAANAQIFIGPVIGMMFGP